MRIKKNLIFYLPIVFSILFLGGLVLAQRPPDSGTPPDSGDVPILENPLPTADPRVIIGYIIKAILGIVGSLALIVFIMGGVTWMTSGGNPEKIKKGRDMVLWAVLGLAVIFTAYAIVRFVLIALTNATSGGGG